MFVGPGTMDWVGGGEDAAKRGEKGLIMFPTRFLTDRTFVEMQDVVNSAVNDKIKSRVKDIKVGPFEKAWDWFGDGTIIVASAEGVSRLLVHKLLVTLPLMLDTLFLALLFRSTVTATWRS